MGLCRPENIKQLAIGFLKIFTKQIENQENIVAQQILK